MRVPRWRTMIEPAVTAWPPKAFTPSRLEFESRPLRDEPPPFLCAIGPPGYQSPERDVLDLQQCELLSMPGASRVSGLRPVLEDLDLVALLLTERLRRDGGFRRVGPDVGVPVVVDDK